jgi:hypothetical protein
MLVCHLTLTFVSGGGGGGAVGKRIRKSCIQLREERSHLRFENILERLHKFAHHSSVHLERCHMNRIVAETSRIGKPLVPDGLEASTDLSYTGINMTITRH